VAKRVDYYWYGGIMPVLELNPGEKRLALNTELVIKGISEKGFYLHHVKAQVQLTGSGLSKK
jgi:hypothetical protein